MTFSRIRQAFAAAGLTLLASTSLAQSLGGNPGMIGAPGPNVMGVVPASPVAPGPAASTFAEPTYVGNLGSFPEQLMTDLALTPEQRAKVSVAQTARQKMWTDNQASRKSEYDELAKELSRGAEFNPHAVIALRKKSRTEMESRMDAVQDLWLEFWDSLDAKQRVQMVDYMLKQHERHGKIRRPGP